MKYVMSDKRYQPFEPAIFNSMAELDAQGVTDKDARQEYIDALEEVPERFRVMHDNGSDWASWVVAYHDFPELKADYATRREAEADAKQARKDHEGIHFAVKGF